MKKVSLLLALVALAATTSFAQTTPTTEVKTRDNGTMKVTTTNPATGETTVTKTGKTNTGATLDATKDAAGNVAHKTGHVVKKGAAKTTHAVKSGARKTTHAVKSGTQKATGTMKNGAEKMEAKTE